MAKFENVLADALALTEEERERLLAGVRMSLSPAEGPDSEYDRLWAEEVRQRLEAFDAGETESIPWADARTDLMRPRD